MFGKRHSRNIIPSEVEGSFWHTGIASYVRRQGRGILLRKEQERAECKEDFSTALEMTVWGEMGLFYVAYNGYVWKALFLYRHPERSPRSFWHTGIASYVRRRKRGNLLRKEQESAECKEDFLTALEMTVGKAADSMNLKF